MTDRELELLELYWEAWMHPTTSIRYVYAMDSLALLAELLAEYLHEEYGL